MSNSNDGAAPQQPQSILQYQSSENGSMRFSLLKDVLNKTVNASLDKPFNANFSTEQSRLESFEGWPRALMQTPSELAQAGFYYYGIKDMVKCFFCNGGLCNWEVSDVAIEEHARWFPKCSYLRQLMGAEYLETIRQRFKNTDSGFTEDFTYDMTQYYNLADDVVSAPAQRTPRPSVSQYKAQPKEREISPTVVLARLDLPGIRKIMNLGFKKTTIQRAIECKLKKDGDDFKNLVDLVSACFVIDENDKKLEEKLHKLFDLALFNVPKQVNKRHVCSLFTSKFHIEPCIIRFLPDSTSTNLILIGLNDSDKGKCDLVVNELNNKQNESLDIENLFTKKLKLNDCGEDILLKAYENRMLSNLEEMLLEKMKSPMMVVRKRQQPEENIVEGSKPENLADEVEKLSKERVCVICLDRIKNIMFLPCAHLAACVECSVVMDKCPICRTKVEATVRTFS